MTAHANDTMLLGYRWVSDEPQGRCERCSALHGREFYYHPGPGQLSVDDLPRRPLHPNCRCDVEPIMDHGRRLRDLARQWDELDLKRGERSHHSNSSPFLDKGGIRMGPFVIGNDGRSYEDAPAYGNCGGRNWMLGRNPNQAMTDDEKSDWLSGKWGPIDDMDASFCAHDGCYYLAETENGNSEDALIECDIKLLKKLLTLPKDVNQWSGPNMDSVDQLFAEKYLDFATAYFTARVAKWYLKGYLQRLPGSDGDLLPMMP